MSDNLNGDMLAFNESKMLKLFSNKLWLHFGSLGTKPAVFLENIEHIRKSFCQKIADCPKILLWLRKCCFSVEETQRLTRNHRA